MTITPMFAWYDLWVGAYWSPATRTLYLMPIPCCGLRIAFGPNRAMTPGPWPAIAIGLLLTIVFLATLAAIALVIGGPR